jgi:hypothetical protein
MGEEEKARIEEMNARLINFLERTTPEMGIFNAFLKILELERAGLWAGILTFNPKDVIKVRDYLNDWMKRKFNTTT